MKFLSQKGQDAWVIAEVFRGQRNGFFLDLAASDGLSINNSLLLERELGWSGIAIEADPASYADLRKNRSCICVNACVDEHPGEVEYLQNGELGGILDDDTDNCPAIRQTLIEQKRNAGEIFKVKTVTLESILRANNAPKIVDYFSFDVEGAETRILRSFPFDQYLFTALTIERPTPELNEILFNNGYVFIKNDSSDTFYLHQSFAGLGRIARRPFEQVPAKDW